ncbi:unnamed protein product [Zymoseptoria tritici ST99CH_3D1]|uniref:DNA-directed RNA polymerase III subunit RPC9 n=2 Tax=Zymoseptoria tritici TaxID=1047171 RepID=A0A1X7RDL5_ZYMT9|nr:unnamed protein product [Zymoseptoria tritici ST99CH_3D7]SMR41837.1 unnamed protein product [Zymoseptoria tritici ST99CH_1E4]SMR44026.1 unnamed protein product [Zymoseptoria tritici ST99CH_3D1]
MKILDAGDTPLSNADVLDWIKRKRAQHAAEDAEDASNSHKPAERPSNFMKALARTERELSSDRYPYTANPSAYSGAARSAQFQRFIREVDEVIQEGLLEEWKERLDGMSKEQIEKQFLPLQEKKNLTEPELLVIYNLAPTCTEQVQSMVENSEERFSVEECQAILDVILRVLRPDEKRTAT